MTTRTLRTLTIGCRVTAISAEFEPAVEFVSGAGISDKTLSGFDAVCYRDLPTDTEQRLITACQHTGTAIIAVLPNEATQSRTQLLRCGVESLLIDDDGGSPLKDSPAVRSIIHEAVQRQYHWRDQHLRQRELERSLESNQRAQDALQQRLASTQRIFENVSHEVRTPLGVVKEYAALLGEQLAGPVNDEQQRILRTIETRADDLHRMVNNMLDMSRLDSVGICRRPLDLQQVVSYAEDLLKRKAECHDVVIDYDTPPSLPPVFGDEDKLRQVLINLVTNAIKYCGRPGHVRVRADFAPGASELVLSISDNGRGIEQDHLQRIFRRFDRLESNQHQASGFGLGLDIAQELVELHFGRLEVESQPGQGTTFRVRLPIHEPREIMRRFLKFVERQGIATVASYQLQVTDTDHYLAQPDAEEELDARLQSMLGKFDLALPASPGVWLILSATTNDRPGLPERIRQTSSSANDRSDVADLPTLEIRCLGLTGPAEFATQVSKAEDDTESLAEVRPQLSVPDPKSRPILRKTVSRRQDNSAHKNRRTSQPGALRGPSNS